MDQSPRFIYNAVNHVSMETLSRAYKRRTERKVDMKGNTLTPYGSLDLSGNTHEHTCNERYN